MPLQLKEGKTPKAQAEAVAAAPVEAPVTEEVTNVAEEEGVVYGSDRMKLAFLCPLGDPSQNDTTTIKTPDGKKDKKVTSTIVGYKFKVLEAMQVPDCGTNEGLKDDPMNYAEIDKWREAQAGEEIYLTPFETALLLSQPRFNSGCDGGEKPVYCVYQNKSIKTKNGKVATASAAAQTPRVSLRATVGSIKDFDIEDVLTFEKVEINGVPRKKRALKPGEQYKKWAPLAVQAVGKSTGKKAGGRAAVDPTKQANKNAMAFLAYVNSRKGAK